MNSPVEDNWYPFDGGATMGKPAVEGGETIADFEHRDGARITLERPTKDRSYSVITCGAYGWFLHTARCSEHEGWSKFIAMKAALDELLVQHARSEDRNAAYEAVVQFVDRFP